ncbi:verprolin, partial [Biomphalaria glabrata]
MSFGFVSESSFNGVHNPLSSDTRRSSPGKELTTKTWKQDRVRERQEVSAALDADREHSERLSHVKKSASTQT